MPANIAFAGWNGHRIRAKDKEYPPVFTQTRLWNQSEFEDEN
jgi:hypothetical protein